MGSAVDGSVYDGSYERIGGRYLVIEGICRFSFCFLCTLSRKGGSPVFICIHGYTTQRIVGGIR